MQEKKEEERKKDIPQANSKRKYFHTCFTGKRKVCAGLIIKVGESRKSDVITRQWVAILCAPLVRSPVKLMWSPRSRSSLSLSDSISFPDQADFLWGSPCRGKGEYEMAVSRLRAQTFFLFRFTQHLVFRRNIFGSVEPQDRSLGLEFCDSSALFLACLWNPVWSMLSERAVRICHVCRSCFFHHQIIKNEQNARSKRPAAQWIRYTEGQIQQHKTPSTAQKPAKAMRRKWTVIKGDEGALRMRLDASQRSQWDPVAPRWYLR